MVKLIRGRWFMPFMLMSIDSVYWYSTMNEQIPIKWIPIHSKYQETRNINSGRWYIVPPSNCWVHKIQTLHNINTHVAYYGGFRFPFSLLSQQPILCPSLPSPPLPSLPSSLGFFIRFEEFLSCRPETQSSSNHLPEMTTASQKRYVSNGRALD